jgi:probable HAF family extracellular repeat protein
MNLLPLPEGYACSKAADINNAGDIVGQMWGSGWDHAPLACLWQGGMPIPLGTLGGDESYASAVNELGQIVGCSDVPDFYDRGFLWEAGVLTSLGPDESTEPGDAFLSDPYDINSAGRVVGETNYGMGWRAAFMWEDGVTTPLGGLACARSINDLGLVVGETTGDWQAALWQDGTLTGLGALPGCSVSWARDINNAGLIVGSSMEGVFSADQWACIWQDNVIANLNDLISPGSGWTLQEATAVNERGWIVGYGRIGGQTHAFLLTPIAEP